MDEEEVELPPFLVGIFISELVNQNTMAQIAANQLDHQMHSLNRMDVDVFWLFQESLVKSLVSISNILWTPNNRNPYKLRSKLFRKRFGLQDTPAPAGLRETRNWYEHIDEKIDDWWVESKDHNFMDRSVMPKSKVRGLASSDFVRLFDPTNGELSVFGRSVNILTMYMELNSVVDRIVRIAASDPNLVRHVHGYRGLPPSEPAS